MKLKDIAGIIDGEVLGDGEIEITGVSGFSGAKEGDITFLSGGKWLPQVRDSKASAVVVKAFVEALQKNQIKARNPQYAFAKLLSHFYVKPQPYRGVSKNAFVSEKASLGQNVSVYAFAYISDNVTIGSGSVIYPGVFVGEGSVLGERCLIYPNVTIREGVRIGNDVIIHAGTVVGADGFAYVFEGGVHYKIPHIGGVIIEDNVEIGANAAIDRATTEDTVIRSGTKIDNLVQVAHNVQIGRNVILAGQTGIGGSSRLGDGVVLGGQVGVADHAEVGAGTMAGAQSGLFGKVERGIYSGSPAVPHREWLKASALFARLPEMKKKLDELEKKVAQLGINHRDHGEKE